MVSVNNIISARIAIHGLNTPTLSRPHDIVSFMGAVQAQDFAAAKWSLGTRLKRATESVIDTAFNEGKFLRTHVLRPTWHFILPENIGWMLDLTAPRIRQFMKTYDNKLDITPTLITQTGKLFEKTLEKNGFQTRTQLATSLKNNAIHVHGQRLNHLVVHAELNQILISGPKIEKQLTYALFADRVPQTKKLSKEESLAQLAHLYFASHGPAQRIDFAWWSGLTRKDADMGIELIKDKLILESIDKKEYFFIPTNKTGRHLPKKAHLLSIYDEYIISYKDRSALDSQQHLKKMLSMGNALTAVILLNGRIVGSWKRVIKKQHVEVILNPFQPLTNTEITMVIDAVKTYSRFIGLPPKIQW